jgi:hypothetical protein
MTEAYLIVFSVIYTVFALLFYIINDLTSIYIICKRNFKNYNIGQILATCVFFPIELMVFITVKAKTPISNFFSIKPFKKHTVKVGDKVKYNNVFYKVLEVKFSSDFIEIVKINNNTLFSDWVRVSDLEEISPLEDLL